MTFESFLKTLEADTYAEPPCELHSKIIREMVPRVCALTDKSSVLDVGCGQGVAFEEFCKAGMRLVCAFAIGEDDIEAAEREAARMSNVTFAAAGDMHNLGTHEIPKGNGYSLVWARHVLEHSPAPYYVLHEFKRILKPGGILYVETPAPDTTSHHEFNRNHYSVLGDWAWACLIERAGFEILEMDRIDFETPLGADTYHWFIARLNK